MSMDPRLLRTFVAVARHGSFSAAAAELGYTQSAVSQHVAALEAELGTPLLRRRPVAVTDAGARLLEHAGPLLLRLAAARADVTRLVSAPAARLVVGASALAVTSGLSAGLAAVRRAWPTASVTVRVLDRAAVAARVADGSVDLGFADGIAAPADPLHLAEGAPLTALAVAQEPLVVLLPAAHPLARSAGLRLTDLADARWIDAPEAAVPLDRLRAVSGVDGYRAALRYEGADVRGLALLAVAGHGLAVLPAPAAVGLGDGVGVPVTAPRLVHRVEVLHGVLPDGPAALLAAALTE